MPKKIGFDNEKYLNEQKAAILERLSKFDNKLYLEFGGKLFLIIMLLVFYRDSIQMSRCAFLNN